MIQHPTIVDSIGIAHHIIIQNYPWGGQGQIVISVMCCRYSWRVHPREDLSYDRDVNCMHCLVCAL